MAARLTTFVVVGIVAATLIAGLIVGAQRDDLNGPVDLIVHNARVYAGDASGTTAEAVAIRGNQILRIGSERDIMRLKRPQTTVIDAQGGSVLPGFNDAHAHLIDGGLALDEVDLYDATTVEDLLRRVEAAPPGDWVIGRGWSPEMFDGAQPTRQMIDGVVADRAVQLVAANRESVWVNTHALKLAHITRRTPSPKGGTIVKDARTGEPTGVLKGTAAALVAKVIPARPADRRAGLVAAIGEANRLGITSVQTPVATSGDMRLLADARRAGDLSVRVYATVAVANEIAESKLSRLEEVTKEFPDDPVLKAGAVQVDSAGDPDVLNRAVRLLDARGLQVAVEVAGDEGVERAEKALEHAVRSNPETHERRDRIQEPVAPYSMRVKVGSKVALGSDWPNGPLSPLLHIQAAAAAVPMKDAVRTMTSAGAFASFDEQRKGTLKAGMLADLVVLSDDLFAVPPSRIHALTVVVTIFDGKVVYRKVDARGTQ